MNTENLTWIAAAGMLATFWRQLLALVQRLRTFIVVKTTLRGNVSQAVTAYLWKHYRRSPFSDLMVQSNSAFVRPISRMQEVAWQLPPTQPMIFLDGWTPIFLGGISSNTNGSGMGSVPDYGMTTLTTIRGLVDIEKLIVAALDEFNASKNESGSSRYRVRRVHGQRAYRRSSGNGESYPFSGSGISPAKEVGEMAAEVSYFKWKAEDIGSPITKDPMGALALPAVLNSCIEEFMRWKESELWFRSKQIPWRRGWLLFGKPGTGKTSIVRALAQKADMPIWSYDLSSLSNEEMVQNWREMQESAPCVALFEDMDAVFEGRDNKLGDQGGGLTFDCILNCLSGIETCDGIFSIITTNHIGSIDPALGIPEKGTSSRPGRLDRAIEMPDLSADCLRRIAHRILADWPEIIDDLVEKSEGFTGAQFTEACVQEALKRYWQDELPAPLNRMNGKHLVNA